jgi:dTDP-4-amino-4,6-dideoxygalactose transaminase
VSESRWRVPLSDIRVDAELLEAGGEALASGWWSMGPRVERFEEAFADYTGAAHALAVSNGTAALHLALLALGCGPGDEVVLPSLNFVAAANSVAAVGATPVFCDILGADDLNLDPADLEAALGPRTKAVILLHYGGFACDLERVLDIAARHGAAVIEDAAHGLGASWNGRSLGTVGAIGCYSFFSNKNMPVGEGGAVVTDDDELAANMRLLRSHGMTTLTWERHKGHASGYDVVRAGFNYRLDEVRAAVALVQLGRLDSANEARRRHAARYRAALDGVEQISLPFPGEERQASSAHHLSVAVLPAGVSRSDVRARMQEDGIQTSVHYPPIHSFSLYSDGSARPLPRTDDLGARILTLPLYPHLSEEQIGLVGGSLLRGVRASGGN